MAVRKRPPSCTAVSHTAAKRPRSALDDDGQDQSATSSSSTTTTVGGYEARFGSMDSYKILKKVGEGGYGSVYKARHLRTGEFVAVKSLHFGGDEDDLLREAELLALCAHNPAVVHLREVARSSTGTLNLVMEFAGESLAGVLRLRGKFSERTASPVMAQLLAGAGAMHEQGIVHRDIKPSNVLVADRGRRVKLCDLGVGKATAKAAPPHTQSVGTVMYMAPEMLLGEEYGAAVDVWALGCVMAELLTGERLFDERSEEKQLWNIADKLGESGMGASKLREMVPVQVLSHKGFDVLRALLQFDAINRITAAAAHQMPWFTPPKCSARKKKQCPNPNPNA